jgi:hypothetical protein
VSYPNRTTGALGMSGRVTINIDPITGLPKGQTQNRITQKRQEPCHANDRRASIWAQ